MTDRRVIAIIPARMASSRFPGKPLAAIRGVPMIGHVYYRTRMSRLIDEVWIATCDDEINQYSRSIGAPCVMTAATHERATERAAEAVSIIQRDTGRKFEVVMMVQGDEPLVSPQSLDQCVDAMLRSDVPVVNLIATIETEEDFASHNVVKTVIDQNCEALYFSREPIPSRWKGRVRGKMLKQLGLIAFKTDYLLRFNSLPQTPLEQIESVDMLRVLEHGDRIRTVLT
ncbi:MAG TPA: 3-deoxy-manno-octulosonate cytidylyltransferase, partial [Thermoanaerobaculia bacterium]|nr:3-deoxy-manno-octulosonate cytidylyltransferase [Thermoanaerobaculia bacterium]